jgi:serine/threonine protein kinase
MAMQIPRTLAGRYKLDRRRGRGGMGTVYEAIDSSLERRVAIKLIREDWTDSAEALQRFRREARASASFAHPNVVTIYDYGIEGDTRAFLVMELLQGRTLRDELKQHQRLALSRIVDIFRGVCAAVEAAHARNLIHRDLKPENIFLTGNTVKVLDFGVAKFLPSRDASAPTRLSSATQAGILVGTPAYMSPEQLLGEDLNVLWDLWAMAVAVYETLTGSLPFVSATGVDSRRAVLTGTFTPLDKYLENPPEKVEAFFTRAFASDPARRPQSATEFLSLLQEMFASQM